MYPWKALGLYLFLSSLAATPTQPLYGALVPGTLCCWAASLTGPRLFPLGCGSVS